MSDELREGFISRQNTGLVELLIKDKDLPTSPDLKQKFWPVFDKELSISNLEKDDIEAVYLLLLSAKSKYLISTPPRRLTWYEMAQYDLVEAKYIIKSKRSQDGFERKMISTNINRLESRQHIKEEGQEKRGLRKYSPF